MNPQANTLDTTVLSICFHIPHQLRASLCEASRSLDLHKFSPVTEENLHITALHLGTVITSTIPHIKEALSNVSNAQRSFQLKNGRYVIMHPDEPYMLWMKYDKDRWHEESITQLEKIFWRIGTWKSSRDRKQRRTSGDKFPQAHITLAYARDGRLLDSLHPGIEVERGLSAPITIGAIDLVEIISKGNEKRYHILDTFDFRK